MPKIQILLDEGKVTFNNNNNNNNNRRKRFRLLNFPRTAILDSMKSLRCLYCWRAEVLLLETIGQRSDVTKSKMAAGGKFKTRTLLCLLLLSNVTFPLSSKICNLGILWSNLGSTRASSRGSLKVKDDFQIGMQNRHFSLRHLLYLCGNLNSFV